MIELLTSVLPTVAAYLLTALLFAGPMVLLWRSLSPPRRLLGPWHPRFIPWAYHPYIATIAAFGFFFGPAFVASFLLGTLPKDTPHDSIQYERLGLLANVAGVPIQVILMVGILVRGAGAQPYQLGLTNHRLAANALFGFLAWAIFLLPILFFAGGVNFVYERVLHIPIDQHSLEKLAHEGGWADWVMLIVAAAVAAPLVEELLFRGLVQPWLVRSPAAADGFVGLSVLMATLFRYDKMSDAARAHQWSEFLVDLHPAFFALLAAVVYVFLRLRSTASLAAKVPIDDGEPGPFPELPQGTDTSFTQTLPQRRQRTRTRKQAVWKPQALAGIWSASLLFAVFHTGVWPSPIPLLGLALVLGSVAYRTQSLVPSIVMHSAFNTVAIIMLVFQVWFGTASPTP